MCCCLPGSSIPQQTAIRQWPLGLGRGDNKPQDELLGFLQAAAVQVVTYARSLLATAEQAKAALQPARQVSGTLRVALADSGF